MLFIDSKGNRKCIVFEALLTSISIWGLLDNSFSCVFDLQMFEGGTMLILRYAICNSRGFVVCWSFKYLVEFHEYFTVHLSYEQ